MESWAEVKENLHAWEWLLPALSTRTVSPAVAHHALMGFSPCFSIFPLRQGECTLMRKHTDLWSGPLSPHGESPGVIPLSIWPQERHWYRLPTAQSVLSLWKLVNYLNRCPAIMVHFCLFCVWSAYSCTCGRSPLCALLCFLSSLCGCDCHCLLISEDWSERPSVQTPPTPPPPPLLCCPVAALYTNMSSQVSEDCGFSLGIHRVP